MIGSIGRRIAGVGGQIGGRGGAVAIDVNAAAFFTAAAITNPAQQSAVNTLVTSLKSAGLWSGMVAIYPFVGGTGSKHSFNLVNPVLYPITWAGTVTHDANGFTGDGSTGHGDCASLASNLCAVNSVAFGCYLRTNASLAPTSMSTTTFTIYGRYITDQTFFDNNNAARISVGTDTTPGLFVSSRVASNDHQGYRNGVSLVSTAVASGGVDANTFSLGADGKCQSFAFLSSGLTPAQNASLYTIVQAYQTALGRQV